MVYASDPAKGHVSYTIGEFDKKWRKNEEGKGTLMTVAPQADFKQREGSERLERKKRLKTCWAILRPIKKASSIYSWSC